MQVFLLIKSLLVSMMHTFCVRYRQWMGFMTMDNQYF